MAYSPGWTLTSRMNVSSLFVANPVKISFVTLLNGFLPAHCPETIEFYNTKSP